MVEHTLFSLTLSGDWNKKKELYVRGPGCDLLENQSMETDTYFNGFSCFQYKKYTNVQQIGLRIIVSGAGIADWICKTVDGKDKILQTREFSFTSNSDLLFKESLRNLPDKGMLYLRLRAGNGGCHLYEGQYITFDHPQNRVKIGIVICTFRREQFVIDNIKKISSVMEETDEGQGLQLEVFCVDNGQNVREKIEESNKIHLFYNRNLGGSAGFCRGIMEILKSSKGFTHVWLMDDDVLFEPSDFERVIAFLEYRKEKYKDLFIAAGMFSLNSPYIQYEATARYNGLTFFSNKSGLDMRKSESIFENERPCRMDYAGWWSCIMPCSVIDKDNLPLPFFIRLDDVEYGLRNMRQCVTLNGLGVWHKEFSEKENACHEYYVTRNSMIISAIYSGHLIQLLCITFVRFLKAVSYGEEKFMRATYQGILDFLRGIDFIEDVDAESINENINKKYGCEVKIIKDGRSGMRKQFLRNLFSKTTGTCLKLLINAERLLISTGVKCEKEYKARWRELTTKKFWEKYLGLN